VSSANPDIDPVIEEQLKRQQALKEALQLLFMGEQSPFSKEEVNEQIKPIVASLLTTGDVPEKRIRRYYKQNINDPNSCTKLSTLVNRLSSVEIMYLSPALDLQKFDDVTRRKIDEIQNKYMDVADLISAQNNSNRRRRHSF
jgi:hypothetical protein